MFPETRRLRKELCLMRASHLLPSIDNSAPLDSATGGEDSVADSDEDGYDPEDSGSEVMGNVPAAVASYREEDSGMEIKSTEIEVDVGLFLQEARKSKSHQGLSIRL
ncbi:hypothetical protein U1Q18_040461 [Sarracenia purpurea var. burkii]